MPVSARSKWRCAAWVCRPAPHDCILKVARTIAGLAGLERVEAEYVAEVVQYGSLDRNYWS
jgi:predicted ATPase with chaperone activity